METQDLSIAWADLTYKVKPFLFSKEKTILNQLSGSAEFGALNAVMGPSGAGKTTLLKCLIGKMNSGLDPNTKIYVNSNVKVSYCFVGQHSKEHLIMCLTAKQNMIYASKLKNTDHKSGSIDHRRNALNIMQQLMIEDIVDTPVSKCSGGEQKRLTIAIEMTKVVKPNILFVDEPTTGLDSISAEMVMDCLKSLSKSHGLSIITSIHQPNHEIVVMFDNIYVLSKDGNCLFSGPPDQMYTHLNDCNIVMNEGQVPIEQLLKLASIETQEDSIELLVQKTRAILRNSVHKVSQNQLRLTNKGLEFRSKSFKPLDVWYLSMRAMSEQYVKQWKSLLFQFLWYILLAIFSANVFNENIGKPDACLEEQLVLRNTTCLQQLEDDFLIFQNLNFIYFMTLLVLFVHLCHSTLSYLTDLKIFFSEHQNQWYSTGSYFWAKNFVELIPTIIFSTIYAYLVYTLSGQYSEGYRNIQFILIIVLGFLCTEGIGHTIGILLINYHRIAVLLSLGLFTSLSMFANYFILIKDMPLMFQYMSELSFFKFVFNSILIIIYGQNRCSSKGYSFIVYKYSISDHQLIDNYIKLGVIALSLRIIPLVLLYLKNNIRLNTNIFAKEIKKCEELIELNKNDSTLIDFNRCDKRLSLILETIDLSTENDRNCVKNNKIFFKRKISIAWIEMTLKIPKTFYRQEKVILREINGFFEFSTINAIMGCSGSGKTSLLKCINGLCSDNLTDETTIYLNNNQRIKTCFITQEVKDHILIGLTAGEAMIYASKLKNFDPMFDHKKNVLKLMEELLIKNIFDTKVENCSNGEQKRLVIATELTSNITPNLLCIDEPTSGLDSNTAEVVIKCLKLLSQNHNICVITSIHQPNNEVLMLFDKLYVLSKYGENIFSGRPQQLSEYLFECDIELSKSQLPIEVLLKQSCNGINDKTVQKMVKKSQEFERLEIEKRIENEIVHFPDGIQTLSKRLYLKDFWILILRGLTSTYRYYWKLIIIQFFIYVFSALTMRQFFNEDIGKPSACVTFDGIPEVCAKTKEKIDENTLMSYNLSYNFFILTNLMFLSITVSAISFTSDLKMFINEQRNRWYSTGAYYWSKTLIELIPTVITLICYSYVVDIYSSEQSMFYGYALYLTVGGLLAQSFGHFIGILFASNQRLAMFASVGVMTIALFFSGFIIPNRELHYSLRTVSSLSPFKMIMDCIIILQYGGKRCSDREFSILMYMFDIKNEDKYRNTQVLFLELIVIRICSLIALLIKTNSFIKSKKREDLSMELEYTVM